MPVVGCGEVSGKGWVADGEREDLAEGSGLIGKEGGMEVVVEVEVDGVVPWRPAWSATFVAGLGVVFIMCTGQWNDQVR